ncbi:MAG: DUF1302 domain-containing protein [Betaproteobacteria bacterium]|nr:DUF1302 domain-containing protein [Betaproteobacteria bacterium]
MKSLFHRSRPALKPLALATLLACSGGAQAFTFKTDNGITGSFDTTLSYGVSVRAQNADASLIGISQGGTARSVNEDDGNRNYKKNDIFAHVLKATHDLDLRYNNWGFFARGTYFVDFENRKFNGLGPEGRSRVGRDARMLDTFVSGSFQPFDKKLNMRVGSQVVSWGESTFIPNGINVINPVDISKLRIPGSELKEAFIPSRMLWLSQEITDKASLEGWVLANHDKIKLDPRGSYWSNNDFASDDGWSVIVGFGRRHDFNGRAPGNLIPPTAGPLYTASVPVLGAFDPAASVWAPRSSDRNVSDKGQYGVAFRYLSDWNNTEFGLYYMNYHSRIPLFSGIKGTPTSALTSSPFIGTICATPALAALCQTGTATYFAEYPENIRLIGLSFNTQGPWGVALQGEYSYRPNNPLQVATPELLLAALGAPNLITGFTQIPGQPVGATASALVPNGTYLRGYRDIKTSQFQITGTKAFPNVLKADQGVIVGEFGYTKYHDMPSELKFNGPGVYLPATLLGAIASQAGSTMDSVQQTGFATTNSWGYRLVGRLDYTGGPLGTNWSPRLAWAHDVKGTSATFNEGVKSVSMGVNFEYQKKATLDLSYTTFGGGRTYCGTDTAAAAQTSLAPQIAAQGASFCSSANPIKDRDFYSVVFTYSF